MKNTYDTHEPTVTIVPMIPTKEYAEQLRAEEERRILELRNFRRALERSGIPAQAALDDLAPPLRISVSRAREIMEGINVQD